MGLISTQSRPKALACQLHCITVLSESVTVRPGVKRSHVQRCLFCQSVVRPGEEICLSCLLAEPPQEKTVPGLELLEVIGRGGMGEVWKARHTRLDRNVAVKLLAGHSEPRHLKREAKLLASLDHPNIVRVYDYGEEGGGYLVMELVDGVPLSAHLPLCTPANQS